MGGFGVWGFGFRVERLEVVTALKETMKKRLHGHGSMQPYTGSPKPWKAKQKEALKLYIYIYIYTYISIQVSFRV